MRPIYQTYENGYIKLEIEESKCIIGFGTYRKEEETEEKFTLSHRDIIILKLHLEEITDYLHDKPHGEDNEPDNAA